LHAVKGDSQRLAVRQGFDFRSDPGDYVVVFSVSPLAQFRERKAFQFN
jgi:hypothetical protein